MVDSRPSFEIAAPSLKPYVQTLWPGALAMPFESRDETGRKISLADDHLSGRYLLLVFLTETEAGAKSPILSQLAAMEERLHALNTSVVAVSATDNAESNRQLKREHGFPWPILCDSPGSIFASYGLLKGTDQESRLVVLTPYRQIRTWFDLGHDVTGKLESVMSILEGSQAAEEARWSPPHAPVLIVPNVLSPEECGKLVESVETDTPFMIRRPQAGEVSGNYRIPVYEHHRQDRVDLIIREQNTLALLDERIFGRIAPMIRKAFAFEITRRENLHIARYVGKREGVQIGHRDNTEPAGAHRRFALSMSLNEDYEGGGVVFREFSPRGYRVPAGSAMVFSSSLLHEVEETTSGVRYNLISHLFS